MSAYHETSSDIFLWKRIMNCQIDEWESILYHSSEYQNPTIQISVKIAKFYRKLICNVLQIIELSR